MRKQHNTKVSLMILCCSQALVLFGCGARSEVQELRPPGPTALPFSCSTLSQEDCSFDERCLATYDALPDVTYLGCIDQPAQAPMCPDISCLMYCAFGFAAGPDGCERCLCAPAIGPCEDMNEDQCQEADYCQGLYRNDEPRGTQPPCPPNAPGCDEPPQNRRQVFVSCLPEPQIETCITHKDCDAGWCQVSDDQDRTIPRPEPTEGQCVIPECSDGSVLSCNTDQPNCAPNSIPTINNGCWLCVDALSCKEDLCEEPPNVNRVYLSRDTNECANIDRDFGCAGGSTYFEDACGCGCEMKQTMNCPPESPDRKYVSRDPQQCAVISYSCDEGFIGFNNECGCGCIRNSRRPPSNPPRTGPVVTDCGEGTQPLCFLEAPSCPPGLLLTVANECWDCVTVQECLDRQN